MYFLDIFLLFFFFAVAVSHHKICVFIILISFFDKVSNFRNSIWTNQERELVVCTNVIGTVWWSEILKIKKICFEISF